MCRHQWRSNKLTNLFWLFSDNVVGCHMSSTTAAAAAFSENRKCELYFSVRVVWYTYTIRWRSGRRKNNFSICLVCSFTISFDSVLQCVCILLYFHFRWICRFSSSFCSSAVIRRNSLFCFVLFSSVRCSLLGRCAWDTQTHIPMHSY